jgi:molybdenum cofactor cytidylyltransferase
MGAIWAIILAAGESKRMGFPKMLLQFDGMTMIERVIYNVTKSDVDDTLVVLGAVRDDIAKLNIMAPVTYCYNDNYKEGMLSSVQCGFRKLPDDFEAALVFQGDQPLIKPGVINKIIGEYRSSGKGIVMPVCEKRRGHPLLIDRKYKDKIENLDARKGLRSLAYQYPDDVLEVVTEDQAVLMDFDTYEDYDKEINQKR